MLWVRYGRSLIEIFCFSACICYTISSHYYLLYMYSKLYFAGVWKYVYAFAYIYSYPKVPFKSEQWSTFHYGMLHTYRGISMHIWSTLKSGLMHVVMFWTFLSYQNIPFRMYNGYFVGLFMSLWGIKQIYSKFSHILCGAGSFYYN